MLEDVNRASRRRTYGQFCAFARALDVVGDRWTLLIVRELLPGPLRYSDLKQLLAGVATNLLADRLRTMEADGLVERRLEDGGVRYALTSWGAELREPMESLGRWGTPLLASGQGDDSFQPRWLTLALPALLKGRTADPPVELGIETDGLSLVLRLDEGGPSASLGDGDRPQDVLTASPDVVVGLATETLSIDAALEAGHYQGDRRVLATVFAAAQR